MYVLGSVGVDALLDVVVERDVLSERLLGTLCRLVPAELCARLPDPGARCGTEQVTGQRPHAAGGGGRAKLGRSGGADSCGVCGRWEPWEASI